jgi:3-methylcrotonyl-CoA carboxylase alpha subunit
MASKKVSKDLMIKAKVPVVPGYHGPDQSPANFLKEAEKIGA